MVVFRLLLVEEGRQVRQPTTAPGEECLNKGGLCREGAGGHRRRDGQRHAVASGRGGWTTAAGDGVAGGVVIPGGSSHITKDSVSQRGVTASSYRLVGNSRGL